VPVSVSIGGSEAEENFIGEENPDVDDLNVDGQQPLGSGVNLPISN
jgi:hypothetical protein